ncbi:MAG: hypothetical protein V4694_02380 [Pseudomonadota bacterium]
MSKNILVKLTILLVVSALVYSVFWFFKVGQVEKQVKNFISKNSAHVSAGDIVVSGFPLAQKITIHDLKFTIPSPLLNKRQVIVKLLEAKAGIFSSEFIVTLPEPVTVDSEGNIMTVEFTKEPEIKAAIADGRISKFSYHDFGYKISDIDKNVVYAATSSILNLESTVADDDKITTKVTADVKEIEGFDVLDVYKNAFEKKVTEGIKTGEIILGNTAVVAPTPLATPGDATATPATTTVTTTTVTAPTVVPADPTAANVPAPAAVPQATVTTTTVTTPAVPANPAAPTAAAIPAAPEGMPTPVANPADVAAAAMATAAANVPVKSNLMIDFEYIMAPNQTEQAQIPTDPTQIQEAPVQYSKVMKINNLEFSNPLCKILINGEMSTLADDNMPSGSVTVKVEKIDALIAQISTGFTQMAEQKKPASTEIQTSDLTASGMPTQDSYQDFLKRVAANIGAVSKELAAKNPVSKGDIAEFDIRREKNLEFLVNETSVREILGKF